MKTDTTFTQARSGKMYANIKSELLDNVINTELSHPQFMNVLPLFIESCHRDFSDFSLDYYEDAYGRNAAESLYRELTEEYKVSPEALKSRIAVRYGRAASMNVQYCGTENFDKLKEKKFVTFDFSTRAYNAILFNLQKNGINRSFDATLQDVMISLPSLKAAEKIGTLTAQEIIKKFKELGIIVERWVEEYPDC